MTSFSPHEKHKLGPSLMEVLGFSVSQRSLAFSVSLAYEISCCAFGRAAQVLPGENELTGEKIYYSFHKSTHSSSILQSQAQNSRLRFYRCHLLYKNTDVSFMQPSFVVYKTVNAARSAAPFPLRKRVVLRYHTPSCYHKETCTLHLWVTRVICQDRCSCSVHHRNAVWCSFGDPTTMNAAAGMEAQSNMFVIAWIKEVHNTWGELILEFAFISGALVAWRVVIGFDGLK